MEKVTIQRANVILKVDNIPDILERYRAKGYNVVDESTGEVIERAVPHDAKALQALVIELQEKLAKSDAKIAELEAMLESGTEPAPKKRGRRKEVEE